MKIFALHTMFIDSTNDIFELGDVKVFKSIEDALTERDQIIMELRDDYDFEEDDIFHNSMNNVGVGLTTDSIYEIKIQEIEI